MVRGASALPHMFFKTFKTAGQVAAAQTKNVQRPLAIENRPTPVLAVSNKSVSQPETNEVFMSGFCRLPTGRYFVTLTDGREYQTGDNQVEWITENRCRINGINYERARWVHEKENSTNNAGIEVANGTPYAGGAGSIPSAVKPRIQELR